MAVIVREYGFDPPPRAESERGRPCLLVLTAPPPATLRGTMRLILHDALIEGEHVIRAARDAGIPVPLLLPVPARDARRLKELLTARGVRTEVHPLGFFRRLSLVLSSDPRDVEDSVERADAFARRAAIDESALPGLDSILREAIANAVHHGNRGVPERAVRVDLVLHGSLLAITVEDEGSGFDHAALLDELARAGDDPVARATQRAAEGRTGGLGLLMIRRWADAVEWELGGRRVRITKQL